MGNFLTVLRLSLGDFVFDVLNEPDNEKKGVDEDGNDILEINPHAVSKTQHLIFWSVWILMVVFSSLVFLNFIIAEVSNSYHKVLVQIDSLIYRERATLTQEAEDIMSDEKRKDR